MTGVGEAEARSALDQLVGLALVRWHEDEISVPSLNDPGPLVVSIAARPVFFVRCAQARVSR